MKTNDPINACPRCGALVPAEAPQGLCPACVFAAAAAPEPAPTATSQIPSLERLAVAFPQLQVIELIGRGGMGFVFKARQPHLDRFVALKLLPDSLAHDPQFAERFNREGRVLARLNHPNIVSIFDFGQAGDFYYLMMEYVDGVNLRQAMQAGRFSPAEALTIVPKICEALQFAHEEGILHRDIKPENILLDAKGRVKIADFGIAKLVGEEHPDVTLTATGAALGTMHYMAPEQIEKPSTVDHRADIYSLGVVFYELLTGELPLGRFGPPSAKTPVDSRVDDVVMRTLEKEREKRFQSAGEMKTEVEHLGEGGVSTVPECSVSDAEFAGERRYSRRSIYGALLVCLSLPAPLTLFVALLMGRGEVRPGELWLALGSVALPGLCGTLLGRRGLKEIRESHGRLRGLPLAMFATFLWPMPLLGALIVGLPACFLMSGGEQTLARKIASFVIPLSPLVVVIFFRWVNPATIRWAGLTPNVKQQRTLNWAFSVGVMAVAVIMMFKLAMLNGLLQRSSWMAASPPKAVIPPPAAKTKVVELTVFGGRTNSITLNTQALFGPDEAMVSIMEQPDGRREVGHIINSIDWKNRRVRENTTVHWNLKNYAGFPPGEAKRIEDLLEKNFAGRPLTLVAGQPMHLFSLANGAGGFLRCYLDYRPDFVENAFRATEAEQEGQAMVRVEQALVSSSGGPGGTLILFLKPSIPPGHSLQPICDGTIGSSGSTRRTISQSSGNASFTCNWIFPASFTSNDVFAAQAQCEKLRESAPLTIPSGGRQLLFAVTNQAGEVHRGYLELVKSDSSGPNANTSPSGMKTSSDGNALGAAAQAAASAEPWAPKLAPGEKPRPYEILQEAARLAKEGQYEQALQRHIWYHHHALEFQPSQAGVRLSFALSQWMELARRYPQAKDALLEIRDQGARAFSGGGGSFRDFMELSSINKVLDEEQATTALFKSTQAQDPELARQCYQTVEHLLVEAGDYTLCASFIPDAQERFEQIRAKREKMMASVRNPKDSPGLLHDYAQRVFIKETRTLVEILVGIGRKSEAEQIRDDAVAVLNDPQLQSAVADAEVRVARLNAQQKNQ